MYFIYIVQTVKSLPIWYVSRSCVPSVSVTQRNTSRALMFTQCTTCNLAWWLQFFNRKHALQIGGVAFERHGCLPRRKILTKDVAELHYGRCRIQGFWSLTRQLGTKSQDILASAVSILNILFFICLSWVPLLYRSAILKLEYRFRDLKHTSMVFYIVTFCKSRHLHQWQVCCGVLLRSLVFESAMNNPNPNCDMTRVCASISVHGNTNLAWVWRASPTTIKLLICEFYTDGYIDDVLIKNISRTSFNIAESPWNQWEM